MNLDKYKGYSRYQYIHGDRIRYPSFLSREYLMDWILSSESHWIRSYLKALRAEEYYTFIKPKRLLKYYYFRKKNRLAIKQGFFISAGCFGLGLHIAHYGSVIINPDARIGENCTIHGICCIGNSGKGNNNSPRIGDNVDIGQGAQLLGDIEIAQNVKIGAGSIVISSILEKGATVVGIPGKIVSKKEY